MTLRQTLGEKATIGFLDDLDRQLAYLPKMNRGRPPTWNWAFRKPGVLSVAANHQAL